MTFERLLSMQNDDSIIESYNDNHKALHEQRIFGSPLGIDHFTKRIEALKKEIHKRGLKC